MCNHNHCVVLEHSDSEDETPIDGVSGAIGVSIKFFFLVQSYYFFILIVW